MVTEGQAKQFAEEWIGAWNQRDIQEIIRHYADAIEFWSPRIVSHYGIEAGVIRDKSVLVRYFIHGLDTQPKLKFTLLNVLRGVDSICIYYRRENGTEVAEVVVLNETMEATMVRVHYFERQHVPKP